jgi:hypothetical protein
VLPHRMTGRVAHCKTAIDEKLMEKTGLDEFTLRRLRKLFAQRYLQLSYTDKRALSDGGTSQRFAFMTRLLRAELQQEAKEAWLRYLEHSELDIDDMVRGEYPISPYIIRVYSALFGIKVDFLLLGSTPTADKNGTNIDVWPMTGTR